MSVKQVANFYNDILKDESIKSKLQGVNEKTLTEEVFKSKILPEAKKKGYDFSYEDVQEYYKKQSEKTELSVDDLENVSGGGCGGGSANQKQHLIIGFNDQYADGCNEYSCALAKNKDKSPVCGYCRYYKVGATCYFE